MWCFRVGVYHHSAELFFSYIFIVVKSLTLGKILQNDILDE